MQGSEWTAAQRGRVYLPPPLIPSPPPVPGRVLPERLPPLLRDFPSGPALAPLQRRLFPNAPGSLLLGCTW